ncbi:MAG: sulfate ABC transporter permease subunit CysT [Chitinispirillaceae bacterium]|nr:sulfate ABC transporter permease subunit CysT [Chitinispirillaceae bacterium]
MRIRFKQHSVLPGFGPSFGYTLFYLGLIVLLPLSTIVICSGQQGFESFLNVISSRRVLLSYRLTLLTSLAAAAINSFFGFVIAWFLVRVNFPGKRIVDALIDLPFALPTAVSGIALTTIYCRNGWIGAPLEKLGIRVAFTPIGITIAMILVGLPFVVRTVQPALEELEQELEEAALSLGAGRWINFRRIILPMIMPALLTGFALAFARSLGEYGSVVFIAGNMPLKTEISALLIITKLEQYDLTGATAVATGMLIISFLLLFLINLLQSWSSRRLKGI